MKVLSSYIVESSTFLDTKLEKVLVKSIATDPLKRSPEVGNLVIREHYTKHSNSYDYMKETMIITKVHKNLYSSIEINAIGYISDRYAYVNKFPETLFNVDGKWYKTGDITDENGDVVISNNKIMIRSTPTIDENSTCENVTLIDLDQIVPRFYIDNSIIKEKDGKLVHIQAENMGIPAWCL